MASYGLLECALTMSLATGFSVERSWLFGEFLSGVNACSVQLQNVGILLTITAMSIDRYFAVTRLNKYHTHTSVHYANYAVLYTWIHACIFALPLLFQNQMLGITCRAFVERCLCGLVEGTSLAFSTALLLLCYLLPFIVIIIFMRVVAVKAANERKRVKCSNTPEYATYCLQESVVLNEARLGRYVIFLVLLYLVFKAPYVMIDVLTQYGISSFYQPVTVANQTVVVDGSKFYYQTVISWMMFAFSATFPIVTFVQFPEHVRRLKTWARCGNTTISAANSGPSNVATQRNIRQKRRQRHIQRRNNAQHKARTPKQSSSSSIAANTHRKMPSSISSNITSEKITLNGNSTQGEVSFRVPVLYATEDGLHLVASEKTVNSSQPNDNRKRKKVASSDSSASSNNNNSADAEPSSSTSQPQIFHVESKISQPSGDLDEELRPSSVVDKRVDVLGSHCYLQVGDEISYMNSDFDGDEDTESELNESANSRTLIWPQQKPNTAKSLVSLDVGSSRSPLSLWNQKSETSTVSNPTEEVDDISHPHTPTPPPIDHDVTINVLPRQSQINKNDDFVDKTNSIRLPKLPRLHSKNITTSLTRQFRPLSQGSATSLRDELLMSDAADDRHPSEERSRSSKGFRNDGYESPAATDPRPGCDFPVVVKRTPRSTSPLHGSNKVHPNFTKPFVSETSVHPSYVHTSLTDLQLSSHDREPAYRLNESSDSGRSVNSPFVDLGSSKARKSAPSSASSKKGNSPSAPSNR
ncbi:uncharacterized protein LOC143459666 isoform X2 [Clavelina lepadiformis]